MELEFFSLHLVIGDESPSYEMLKPIFEELNDHFTLKKTHYLIEKSLIEDKYFWLYMRYGQSSPRSPTVYNVDNQEEEENPRTASQIEPNKQLFGLYCLESKTLYLSQSKKKNLLEAYLKSCTEKEVCIKPFYKNIDEFIAQLKTIHQIKLVGKQTLFSLNGEIFKIFSDLKDLYGLGIPDGFSITTDFSNVKKTTAFVAIIKKMLGAKNACELETLICAGRDDKNLEIVLNADSFTQKLIVQASKDDQGMYESEIIKADILKQIKGRSHVHES